MFEAGSCESLIAMSRGIVGSNGGQVEDAEGAFVRLTLLGECKHGRPFRLDMLGAAVSAAACSCIPFEQVGRLVALLVVSKG